MEAVLDKVRVGIIGVGWPGQMHMRAYKQRDDVEITAIADVNTEAAESVKRGHDLAGARVWGDYEEMLQQAPVDAVSIATPNFLHAPMAVAALQAGKHVLLEKPLAHTLEEGTRIARAAAASDALFMMAFNNRYRRDSRYLKGRIERGELGEIYYAKSGWLRRDWNPGVRGWFTRRELSGGGPLIDLGVHMLDLALWFMGNPRPVSVSGAVYGKFTDVMRESIGHVDVEDLASAFVKLDSGASVVFDVSWVSHIEYPDYVYTQLFGTQGGAKVERYHGNEDMRVYGRDGDVPTVETPRFDSMRMVRERGFLVSDSFYNEVSHFVESVKAGTQPDASITHGLDVLRILDAIYRSGETGREVRLDGDDAPAPTEASEVAAAAESVG